MPSPEHSTDDPAKPSTGELPPKHSTSTYNPYNKPVLRQPIEVTMSAPHHEIEAP